MDVYCKDKICPICDKEMHIDFQKDLVCYSGCYKVCWGTNKERPLCVMIFSDYNDENEDDWFRFEEYCFDVETGDIIKADLKIVELAIEERVKYWRKDYRYIAEILTNEEK